MNRTSFFAGAVLSVVLVLTACARSEPEMPKGGDVIHYVRAPLLEPGTPGITSVVSIYEPGPPPQGRFRPKGDFISGKRIRFRVDHSLIKPSNRADGPHFDLTIRYDAKTLGPSDHERSRTIVASLRSGQVGGNLTPGNITRSEAPFEQIGVVPPGGLERRVASVCGLDTYDVTIPGDWENRVGTWDGGVKAERFRDRFGGSLIFGVEDSHGRYTGMVSCSGYSPTCTAITSYRGWPVRIVFGSDQICDYREIAASTQLLFDRFYLDETERSSGQEDRLWFPAEIRDAQPRPDTKVR